MACVRHTCIGFFAHPVFQHRLRQTPPVRYLLGYTPSGRLARCVGSSPSLRMRELSANTLAWPSIRLSQNFENLKIVILMFQFRPREPGPVRRTDLQTTNQVRAIVRQFNPVPVGKPFQHVKNAPKQPSIRLTVETHQGEYPRPVEIVSSRPILLPTRPIIRPMHPHIQRMFSSVPTSKVNLVLLWVLYLPNFAKIYWHPVSPLKINPYLASAPPECEQYVDVGSF